MEVLVAAIVASILEVLKRWLGPTSWMTRLALVAISFCGAAILFLLQSYGLWDAFYKIILMAAGIYALFLKYIPEKD